MMALLFINKIWKILSYKKNNNNKHGVSPNEETQSDLVRCLTFKTMQTHINWKMN